MRTRAMRAGALRDRITIKEQAKTDDGQGGKTAGVWSAISNGTRIPARVTPPESGPESETAGQVQAGATFGVLVRYRTGVKADQQVVWHAHGGDRTLYIVSAPVVVGYNEGLRFEARQGVD